MGWRVLFIEESDSASLYLDNIKVKRGTNEFTFPLSDIALVLIDNYKINITINLINACSLRNIPIVSCGDNHHPLCITLPLNGHFEATKIFLNQLKWSEDKKAYLWQKIVQRKILCQKSALLFFELSQSTQNLLNEYIDSVQLNDITNREGQAAKVYFHALFGINFSRTDENVINACLNYGYSLIRAMICRCLVAKGLNTQLGIFHKGPQNGFNLADDVIEIFRPIIDCYVYSNFRDEKIFTRNIRTKMLEIFGLKIEVKNEKITIQHAVEKFVDSIIDYFNNDQDLEIIGFDPILYDDL